MYEQLNTFVWDQFRKSNEFDFFKECIKSVMHDSFKGFINIDNFLIS